MALSINCNKDSFNDFSLQSHAKISNSVQQLKEEQPLIQSAPGEVLLQSPSFGCLVKERISENEISQLKSPEDSVS